MGDRISLDHKTKVIAFRGYKELERLKLMEHHRPITDARVKELLAVLQAGKPLMGVITVNNVTDGRGERFRVIDGSNRISAYLQFSKENPDVEVQLEFHIYDHLSREAEYVKFEECNNIRKVTRTQLLGVVRDTIPVWKMAEISRQPCKFVLDEKLTPEMRAVDFVKVARAYLQRFTTTASVGWKGEIDEMRRLDGKDFDAIKEFLSRAIAVCGEPTSENRWMNRYPVLASFCKVYYCNMGRLGWEEFAKRFKEKVLGNPVVVQLIETTKGSFQVPYLVQAIVDAANHGYTRETNKFVTVKDYHALATVK